MPGSAGALRGGLVGARHAVDSRLDFSFTPEGIKRGKKKRILGRNVSPKHLQPQNRDASSVALDEFAPRCWRGSASG